MTRAMTRTVSIGILSTTLSLAGATAPASAQQPPTSEARIQELIRLAAERVAQAPAQTQTTQTTAVATGDTRPVVQLGLDDAVRFALERNLDIQVQRLNPQINDIAVASIQSVYHPNLTSTLSTQSNTQAGNSTLSGTQAAGQTVVQGNNTFNGGLSQSVPWGGGALAIQINNNRTTTTSLNALINPTYNTNWSGQYTQPLMRGFRTDSTRQQLAVARINRDISDVQLKASITNTLSNVRNAYWDYVFATEAVQVAQRSLDLATKLVQDNQTRVEVGTMAPIDVVQARSEQATRRQALVSAQSTRRTTELVLKRLIVSGTDDPNWDAAIDPTDRPDFRPEAIDIPAAVRRALSERTDIDIAKKNTQNNDVTLKYLQDQMRPQADLVAFYGFNGQGGTQLVTEGQGVNRTVVGRIPGGYVDALVVAVPQHLAPVAGVDELQLPARPELGAGVGGAGAGAVEPGAGAAETGRAAGGDRRHQRGDHRTEHGRSRPGRASGPRARAAEARGGTEQVRGRHVDELLRRPGPARSRRRREQRAPRGAQLPQGAGRAGARAEHHAAEPEHHASSADNARRAIQ